MTHEKKILVSGLVLAAGKGTRMKSDLPKVLHTVAGKPMLSWVVDSLRKASIKKACLVIGGDETAFKGILDDNPDLVICLQKNRLGTADAVAASASCFEGTVAPYYSAGRLLRGSKINSEFVIVCAGDTPALNPGTLQEFWRECTDSKSMIGVLGMEHPNPTGYGRILLDDKRRLQRIVEEKDADAETKKIRLCNSGVIFAKTGFLFELLNEVKPDNAQKEYYLTDCFEIACRKGFPPHVFVTKNYKEFDGINDMVQLKKLEAFLLNDRS